MKRWIFTSILISFWFLGAGSLSAADSCSPEIPCEEGATGAVKAPEVAPQFHGEKICVYYFYGAGCKECAKTTPFIENLTRKYSSQVELKKLEIYYDEEMRELFYDFVARYGGKREKAGVPAVFLGDTYLGGPRAIFEHLEERLSYFISHPPEVCPLDYTRVEGEVERPQKLSLTLPAVILAAAVDSINPCALSVLIFLLVYLLALKAPGRVLRVGLTYTFSVFSAYFLAGLGLLRFVQLSGVSSWIARMAGGVAVLTGLVNIKDFFWPDRGPSLKIPESKKPILERWIKRASIPAAVVLGFLVSAFELPCTGGVYLAILSLLAKRTAGPSVLGYLLLYNLVFVFPLALIVLMVYRGISPEKLEKLRVEKRRLIRLLMGLVMLGLGVGLLLGWF